MENFCVFLFEEQFRLHFSALSRCCQLYTWQKQSRFEKNSKTNGEDPGPFCNTNVCFLKNVLFPGRAWRVSVFTFCELMQNLGDGRLYLVFEDIRTKSMLACLLACLLVCLHACLLACLLARLLASLLACLFACLLVCLLA